MTLVHRADALEQLLGLLSGRFGGITLFPLFPREGEPASRIILQGIKGSRAPLTIARGLVLHQADGSYTADADRILREGRALAIGAAA